MLRALMLRPSATFRRPHCRRPGFLDSTLSHFTGANNISRRRLPPFNIDFRSGWGARSLPCARLASPMRAD